MQAAANAAWGQNWEEAVLEYERALAEFPREAGALTGLGLAHTGAGNLEGALDAFQRASAITPSDPVPNHNRPPSPSAMVRMRLPARPSAVVNLICPLAL